MFTGIVEELGTVKSISRGSKSIKLTMLGSVVLEDVKIGDSIAVNGVCLTVTEFTGQQFTVDVMAETMDKTNLGELKPGNKVNLERALRLSDRLGGHIVSGHIDGVGAIINQEKVDIAVLTEIKAPPEVLKYVVKKGSVTIDGISLTVVEYSKETFTVSLIPHTAKVTTLGFKKKGDRVNLEGDVLGKYIERLMEGHKDTDTKKNISLEFLASNGFI